MTAINQLSRFARPMNGRDSDESHRAATPLELLFDLVSVIAIAAAAAGLHHAMADDHAIIGIIKFSCAFFAIWWAWMNYTWFASAYDNDDSLFRILTMVIMAGALAMAAGVDAFFESRDLRLIIAGYVIMRIGMVCLWLRAARHDPAHRTTALIYAVGISLVQLFWISFAVSSLDGNTFYGLFLIGIALELSVPVIAERKNTTSWHRHHIIERYGLLNIIVLGETLLAGSMALEHALGESVEWELVRIALYSLVILFSMWWLYFSREDHLENQSLSRALVWGYGHILVFGAGAAVGTGVAVLVDIATDHAQVSEPVGLFAVAVPAAMYLIGLWLIRDRFVLSGYGKHLLLGFAILMMVTPLLPFALEALAGLMVLAVIARSRLARTNQL